MGKIKDLPLLERPREKAQRYGLNTLSNAELLAIIIGSGTRDKSALDIANELLSTYNGLQNLMRIEPQKLTNIKGISTVSSMRIASCFLLANKAMEITQECYPTLKESYQHILNKYSLSLSNLDQEQMHLICLNKKGKIICEKMMYQGTERQAAANPNEIIKEALIYRCKNLILIHNHPNGTNEPSDQDLVFTDNLIFQAKRFHINVYDHLIFSENGYVSMFSRLE